MSYLRRPLALVWLLVALAIAASSVMDLGVEFWRSSWLIVGVIAGGAAAACSASLYLEEPRLRIIGAVAASSFLVYCAYLFAISPPAQMNSYLLMGAGLIALSLITLAILFVGKKRSPATPS